MTELTTTLKHLTPKQRDLLLRRLERSGRGGRRQADRIPRLPRRPEGRGELPVSFAQQRLWFLDRLEPGSPFYNLPAAIAIAGRLDAAALGASLREVVRRHEALRTTFVTSPEGPLQVVHGPQETAIGLPLVDLRALPAAARAGVAERLATEEAQRPFDLERGPLLRALLLRLEAERHLAVLTFHHIVSDGWSMGVLVREIGALYPALRAGRPSPLPELPIQYADFAQWQRDRLAGPELAGQLAYWREQLRDVPAVSQLPTDRPRPAVQRFHGHNVRQELAAEAMADLRRLCQRENATPFMGLLAAFFALLARASGTGDLTVGTPVAGRTRAELEGLIGLFLNTLVLRLRLPAGADPSFGELLGLTRRLSLGALANQELPFSKLVAELSPERDLSHTPLFQVQLVLAETGSDELRLPDLTLSLAALEESTSKLDLTLRAHLQRGGVELVWLYNTDLFDEATLRRLGAQLATLLAAAAADPGRTLADLPLLRAAEEHQLLAEWNDSAVAGWLAPAPGTLHGVIAAQAARTPERPAVSCDGAVLRYGELVGAARRLARRLRRLGVGPDVVVGVLAERSLEMVVGLLAVLEAGGAYLPLDPSYPAERLAYMLADAAAGVLLAQERLLGKLPAHGAAVVPLDGAAAAGGAPPVSAPAGAEADNLCYVIYTSGSTGRPKGTMNTHRGIVNRLLWMQERYGLRADDRVLQKTPFSFDVSVWELFWPLLAGARLVMARPGGHQDPAYLAAAIAGEAITTVHFVPSLLRAFLEVPELEARGGLRRVIASGEALPPELVRRFHERLAAELHNLYGPTEAAVDVTSWACERQRPGVVPIGRPVANTRIVLLERSGRPAPVGVAGELHIGGVQLARGYLGRPDLTAERFLPDPLAGEPGARLYRTGDLARTLPDGAIEFLGRIDQQVKLRGLRIELGEVEAALAGLPGVQAAAVMARADGGEARLVAYLVAAPPPALAEVRAELGRSLPDYMLPGALVVLDALPLTASGKVDRKALPAPAGRPETGGGIVPPRTPLESYVAGLWREVLGVGELGVHDDFFAVGGTSISGAVLINRLQRELEEILHVVVIFDHPTVARLADYLAGQHAGAVAARLGIAVEEQPFEEAPPARVDEAMLERLQSFLRHPPALPAETARLAKNPPALFVLAPPRSGTTLLRVMLGGHPELFAPPELELLGFDTLRERRAAFGGRDAFRLEGAIRAVMEARQCGAEEARALLDELAEEGTTTHAFYGLLQAWIGGRMLVDKTPTYAWSPAALARAEAGFDGARYVHLLRHPSAAIASFVEARIEQVFFPAAQGFSRRQLAEMSWLLAQRNIRDFLAGIPAERRHSVRFEELVAEPERVLRRLCGFLGLAYHPDMAEPYRERSSRMTDGLHAESRMLGDVKFHQHAGIDARVGERWREAAGEDLLGEATRRLAAGFGYELGPEPEAWAPIPRAAAGGPLPLSFAQERMWFLHQLDPAGSAYNICGAVRLRGRLDEAVLDRCFAEVVRRHETLRTTFSVQADRPVQIVQAPAGPALPLIDLAALPESLREEAARRLAAAEKSRPFDLLRGPVCRFTLLRLAGAEHALLLTLHHVCADGWSMVLLVRELAALYRAFAARQPSPLPELPIQYRDFAVWQRDRLQGERLAAELDWWRQRLAGELPPLRLPADRRRSTVHGFQPACVETVIPAAVVRGLHELMRRGSASLYMVLLAAWTALLVRVTGEEDVVIGAPTANRTRPEVEGLIGFFLNTLVLRTGAAGNPPFLALLGRVRETVLGAFAHQGVPLQTVLQATGQDRSAQTAPFQVMFLLQNLPPQEVSVPGMTFSTLEAERFIQDLETPILEAGLTLAELPEGLSASITYNGFLFDGGSILRLVERYGRLLAEVAADPGRPLWSYELLGAAERAEVLAWGTAPPAPEGAVVPRAFAARAAATPEATAVVDGIAGGATLTYGELDRRSSRLARRLRALGAGAGAVVGVALERSAELIVAFLAALASGGAYVPLDPAEPAGRLHHILEDSRASVVLTTSALRNSHPALAAAAGRATLLLDDTASFPAARAGGPPDDEPEPEIVPDPDHLAYVIYTSGSTGRPKGVMVRHGSLASYVAAFRDEHRLGPQDRVLQLASLGFDTSAEEIYPCLTSGATLVLRDDAMLASTPDFLRTCGALGVTVLDLPTAFWHEMTARLAEEESELPRSLRLIVLGGERALPERLAAWHGLGHDRVRLVNTYGPTETTIVATRRELAPGLAVPGEVPIGRPVPGARAYVLDPCLELSPVGVAGELGVAGAGLARGYLGRPGLTAERFVPDSWTGAPGSRLYRTGDRVRWLPSGDLEFLGRVDDQVKIRGYRVEPREIEATLGGHPAVAAAVVVARHEAPDRLAAYVVPRHGEEVSAAELRAFLRERLPEYMVPASFDALESLPLTASGKVDRRALPAPQRVRPAAGEGFTPPRTPAEETIAAIWSEVLGLEHVGATDSFFDLGGHSLLLPQVMHRLRTAFQVEIPLRALFDEPTVERLALAVEEILVEDVERQLAALKGADSVAG